jgi:hypothetical protein
MKGTFGSKLAFIAFELQLLFVCCQAQEQETRTTTRTTTRTRTKNKNKNKNKKQEQEPRTRTKNQEPRTKNQEPRTNLNSASDQEKLLLWSSWQGDQDWTSKVICFCDHGIQRHRLEDGLYCIIY